MVSGRTRSHPRSPACLNQRHQGVLPRDLVLPLPGGGLGDTASVPDQQDRPSHQGPSCEGRVSRWLPLQQQPLPDALLEMQAIRLQHTPPTQQGLHLHGQTRVPREKTCCHRPTLRTRVSQQLTTIPTTTTTKTTPTPISNIEVPRAGQAAAEEVVPKAVHATPTPTTTTTAAATTTPAVAGASPEENHVPAPTAGLGGLRRCHAQTRSTKQFGSPV
mmetsp:Transcript_13257/g.28996  ORF Transcript_13257/g.28996 Transcript_13257/m.28996 type:complete len:217 (-) Transcript_13257:254-904(-)